MLQARMLCVISHAMRLANIQILYIYKEDIAFMASHRFRSSIISVQDSILSKMIKMPFGLDYATNIERLCGCTCQACMEIAPHSAGNCEYICSVRQDGNLWQYNAPHDLYYECDCKCEFCASGVVVLRHNKFDCMLDCYKSLKNMKD